MKQTIVKGGMKPKAKTQGTAVGGGAKASGKKTSTPSSAPMDAHTMGRAPAGWLK